MFKKWVKSCRVKPQEEWLKCNRKHFTRQPTTAQLAMSTIFRQAPRQPNSGGPHTKLHLSDRLPKLSGTVGITGKMVVSIIASNPKMYGGGKKTEFCLIWKYATFSLKEYRIFLQEATCPGPLPLDQICLMGAMRMKRDSGKGLPLVNLNTCLTLNCVEIFSHVIDKDTVLLTVWPPSASPTYVLML